MNFIDAIDKIEWLKHQLRRRVSFVLIQVAVVVFFFFRIEPGFHWNAPDFNALFPTAALLRNNAVLALFIDLVLCFFWIWYRRLPRFSKTQSGIVFAIRTDNDKVGERIKHDFAHTVSQLLLGVDQAVKVAFLPEYHTEKLLAHPKLLPSYHRRTRATMIVYGSAGNRFHQSKDHYYLELDESVAHHPVPPTDQTALVQDMLTVFPKVALLPVDNEFDAFRLHSTLFSYGAKYVIGAACLYSGRPELALQYHTSIVHTPFQVQSSSQFVVSSYHRINDKARNLAIREAKFLARYAYFHENNIGKMGYFLEQVARLGCDDYEYQIFRGIHCFATGNIGEANNATDQARSKAAGDKTWAYNKAFLLAYEGKLQEAYDLYKIAFSGQAPLDVHIQCETFIRRTIEREPNMFQLHYCLGLLYFNMHQDLDLARSEFSEFLVHAKNHSDYAAQIPFAEKYIRDITAKLKKNP